MRQKTRWVHGIALQSWDRLGWSGSAVQRWMTLRDRRGPLAALLLFIAYLLVPATLVSSLVFQGGDVAGAAEAPILRILLMATFAGIFQHLPPSRVSR